MKGGYQDLTLALEDQNWWYRGRRRVLSAVLDSLPAGFSGPVLDAGCGGGANLARFSRFGPLTGLEVSSAALAVAAEREPSATFVQGRLEEMPFPDSEFSMAAALDVVEHLDDDVGGFAELRRVVRPGGFLVVTVPAYPRLWGPHDIVNEHRRRYVRKTLLGAATDAGWTPVRVSHFNSLLLPLATARRLMDRSVPAANDYRSDFERLPQSLNGLMELPLRLEAQAIGAGAQLPAGLSIIALFSRG